MELTRKHITSSTDGFELAYWLRRAAEGGDRYLLLVHGGASNHTRWSEFAERTRLAAAWHLIAPDMRGNGASLTRGRQDIPLWCADLLDILDAENAPAGVIAGHSLGAQIAVHFAHRNPDRTLALVLIDPLFASALQGKERLLHRGRWLVKGLIAMIRGLNALGFRRRRFPSCDLRELDRKTRLRIRDDESFEAIAREYRALGPILRYLPTANYLHQVLETVRPLPPLSDIQVPVLVLLSGSTTLANIDQNKLEANRFPVCDILTLEANHWPLTETPEAVRDSIDGWLSRRFAR
jgi:pimeloyl-ACP methyl ester carboxylesterase